MDMIRQQQSARITKRRSRMLARHAAVRTRVLSDLPDVFSSTKLLIPRLCEIVPSHLHACRAMLALTLLGLCHPSNPATRVLASKTESSLYDHYVTSLITWGNPVPIFRDFVLSAITSAQPHEVNINNNSHELQQRLIMHAKDVRQVASSSSNKGANSVIEQYRTAV